MGLYDALSNSVAGASAQAFALNNISGNIANTQTAGFKTTETSFADMLAQTTRPPIRGAAIFLRIRAATWSTARAITCSPAPWRPRRSRSPSGRTPWRA
jgi:flagellar basal body rod protein FlgB